jgi:hypothetical protein
MQKPAASATDQGWAQASWRGMVQGMLCAHPLGIAVQAEQRKAWGMQTIPMQTVATGQGLAACQGGLEGSSLTPMCPTRAGSWCTVQLQCAKSRSDVWMLLHLRHTMLHIQCQWQLPAQLKGGGNRLSHRTTGMSLYRTPWHASPRPRMA